MNSNNLKILINNVEADYLKAEDIGLSLNRIVDDFKDLSKRFGEFSYEFSLPVSKNNDLIFSYPLSNGRRRIFSRNQNLTCRIYNNDALLIDGVLNLISATEGTYNCVVFSKLKSFNDAIQDKTLKDLNFGTISNFNYETYIVNHLNANYQNSDETYWQFPFIYYGTIFTPAPTYTGKTDYDGYYFDNESRAHQLYYYGFNSVDGNEDNRYYHHQFPPAFYIVSIVKQIFKDAGWRLSGRFFEDENIKRIIMLYAGKNDEYDQATGQVSGSVGNLVISKLLPNIKQKDFLNDLINMFNLYFKIDIDRQIIKFETHDTYFKDSFDPYDITDKIKKETILYSTYQDADQNIEFSDPLNSDVFGDNMMFTGNTTSMNSINWYKVDDSQLFLFNNHKGLSDKRIKVGFSQPTVKRTMLWNDTDVNGVVTNNGTEDFIHPLMTKQTPTDSNNTKFNKKETHNYLFNTEDTIKHAGKPMLMYYYGQSNNVHTYLNIYHSTTLYRVPIGIASPYQLLKDYTNVDNYLSNPEDDPKAIRTIQADTLKSLYLTLGNNDKPTDFSLVFGDSGLHHTIYSKFYKLKIDRYVHNTILEGEIMLSDFDWNQLQLERPVKYNNEIYHLLSIEEYNPINHLAKIKLIKH